MFGDLQVFDFDEVANQLLEQGVQSSPSQLHGCLCGVLAAGAAPEAEVGMAALNQALELDLHGELADQIMQLYTVTAASLSDDEFDFHPLLPDDSTDIALRTEAMAQWCRGFLAGYAQVSAGAGGQRAALARDSGEILTDFAVIAEAGVDEDSEEEESESSYAELVEFIRFAALNAYMDAVAGLEGEQSTRPQGRPLH